MKLKVFVLNLPDLNKLTRESPQEFQFWHKLEIGVEEILEFFDG
jgi:hypothetical protein